MKSKKVNVLKIMVPVMIVLTLVLGACTSAPKPTTTTTTTQTTQSVSTNTSASTTTSVSTSTATTTTSSSSTSSTYTVNLASKADFGNYLVDANGRTLYYFAKDTIGTSNASGNVLASWPIFYQQVISVPSTLNSAAFGTLSRPDGALQTTYLGWPLYYYAKDQKASDTLGDGINGVWFLVKVPMYTIMEMNKAVIGSYISSSRGMTLYYFTNDSPGFSTVSGNLSATWPAFSIGTFIVPSSMKSSDFGTLNRTDGTTQVTYKGYPLYYYSGDMTSGDTNGQGIGNKWYVVNPANFPPAATTTTTTTTTPTTTTTTTTTSVPPTSGGGY